MYICIYVYIYIFTYTQCSIKSIHICMLHSYTMVIDLNSPEENKKKNGVPCWFTHVENWTGLYHRSKWWLLGVVNYCLPTILTLWLSYFGYWTIMIVGLMELCNIGTDEYDKNGFYQNYGNYTCLMRTCWSWISVNDLYDTNHSGYKGTNKCTYNKSW